VYQHRIPNVSVFGSHVGPFMLIQSEVISYVCTYQKRLIVLRDDDNDDEKEKD
jgi:hypothetical protein